MTVCNPESPRPVPPSGGGSMAPDAYATPCASTDGRLLLLNITTGALTELDGSPILDGATAVACTGIETDYELVCASTDGRLLKFDAIADTFTELDGSPILDGATGVPCSTPDSRRLAASELFCVASPLVPGVCTETTQTFTIPSTMVLDVAKINSSGPNVHNLKYTMGSSGDADFIEMLLGTVATPGNYSSEDIGPGIFTIWYSWVQVGNIVRLSPTEVGFTIFTAELPPAPPSPCVDPAPSGGYASGNALNEAQWGPAPDGFSLGPLNVQVDFVIYTYTSTEVPAVSTIVERRKWQELDGTITVEDWVVDANTGIESLAPLFPSGSVWSAGPCLSADAEFPTVLCGGDVTEMPLPPQPVDGVYGATGALLPVVGYWQELDRIGQVGGGFTIKNVPSDSNITDGTYWDVPSTQAIANVYGSIADGSALDSIIDNVAGSWPFSAPVVWDFATDPAGTIFLAAVQAEMVSVLNAMGIPYSEVVFATSGTPGAFLNYQFTVKHTTTTTDPLYLAFITDVSLPTSTNVFNVQERGEGEWAFPSVVLPDVLTGLRVEVQGDWSGVNGADTVHIGVKVAGNFVTGTWNFDNATHPYMTLANRFGAGPILDTFVVDLVGTDPFFASPYAITAADLPTLEVWLFADAPNLTQRIDGVRLVVDGTSLVTTPAVETPIVAVCQTQLDDLAVQIAAAIGTASETYMPRMIENSGFGFSTVSLSGVASISVACLAGSVVVLPPADPGATLAVGETVKWEIYGPQDVLDAASSISVQGNSVDARWHIVWEQA